MPRRPSKKSKNNNKPRGINRADAKVVRWNDRSDIPLDEEDQFHASRDEILLDGDQEEDEDMEDEEVFGLKGMSDSDEEEEEEEEKEDNIGFEAEEQTQKSSQKKKKTAAKKGKDKATGSDESESEEESWGRNKSAYYSSNAAQLDSEDEEGNQLEEQEAKRLQAKARDDMVEDDFGLEDPVDVQPGTLEADPLQEVAPTIPSSSLPQDKESLLRHLEKTDPESLALARDWTDTAESLVKTREKVQSIQNDPDVMGLGLIHVHYQTLLTYSTTLAFYLHLRAQEKYAAKPELLKSHPIIKRLLTLKHALLQLEDLNFAADLESDELGDEDEDEELELDDEDFMMLDTQDLWRNRGGLDEDEDEEDGMDSEDSDAMDALAPAIKPAKPKAPALVAPPKKKRKTSNSAKSVVPIFDLEEPEYAPSVKSASRTQSDTMDAFGEATILQHADAADKSARKKSLRFHTSRIESTSARRQGARNNALGGDDDIPYRERKKDREDRLVQEAKSRDKNQEGADLDDTEPEPRNPEEEDTEGADGYYELVKKKSKEKKEQKKAEYEAARAAERVFDEDESSGPRSLTRAILANKGLTPHRSKSVRNPRVKKRQKFEKAKKKVASQKAVYKGGLADTRGRYEGEKSGISKVVKSVRLG
ncbi:something about silencing protein 10 [Stygiomarasmius scandens]|uniref:Something about silencing protein 10 n=1 Tax=Marasmiellus scandens TaxID=2682957 RepID=A0ABR1K1S5_9AGAR